MTTNITYTNISTSTTNVVIGSNTRTTTIKITTSNIIYTTTSPTTETFTTTLISIITTTGSTSTLTSSTASTTSTDSDQLLAIAAEISWLQLHYNLLGMLNLLESNLHLMSTLH